MQHLLSQAADVIHANRYCALATCSLDGKPWNCPVRYSVDDSCRLFWISATESQHARLLLENPRALITMQQLSIRNEQDRYRLAH
jgi:nitroimidazol reductase NimA-like FMN-containing flavoprotein (pyridoxamine 5'-phosphate oxidase superfamily)